MPKVAPNQDTFFASSQTTTQLLRFPKPAVENTLPPEYNLAVYENTICGVEITIPENVCFQLLGVYLVCLYELHVIKLNIGWLFFGKRETSVQVRYCTAGTHKGVQGGKLDERMSRILIGHGRPWNDTESDDMPEDNIAEDSRMDQSNKK